MGCRPSRFGETDAKLALIPGDDGTFFPQSILGYAKAMEFSLTGRIVPADDALTRSLLNDLMEVEALEEETEQLARSILDPAAFPGPSSVVIRWLE